MRRLALFLVLICVSIAGCDSNNFHLIPIKKYVVPQNGMFPNIPANSSFWAFRKPLVSDKDIKRGEIILFNEKKDGKNYIFVWRVIGLPGDNILINDTTITINGVELTHQKTKEDSEHIFVQEHNNNSKYLVAYKKNPDPEKRPKINFKVPNESFFVMGDNRDAAYDSRFTTEVSFEKVIGRKI